jgi:uncharacterized membrane protein
LSGYYPHEEALVGDYSVGIGVQTEKASKKSLNSDLCEGIHGWGWIGIGIIILVMQVNVLISLDRKR